MTKRVGIIEVSASIYCKPEIMQKLFRYFTPIRTEFNTMQNKFRLFGESEQFNEMIDGGMLPVYEATITEHNDKTFSVSFNKIK